MISTICTMSDLQRLVPFTVLNELCVYACIIILLSGAVRYIDTYWDWCKKYSKNTGYIIINKTRWVFEKQEEVCRFRDVPSIPDYCLNGGPSRELLGGIHRSRRGTARQSACSLTTGFSNVISGWGIGKWRCASSYCSAKPMPCALRLCLRAFDCTEKHIEHPSWPHAKAVVWTSGWSDRMRWDLSRTLHVIMSVHVGL